MKTLRQLSILFFLLVSINLNAQKATHIYGDVMIKLSTNADIDQLVDRFQVFEGKQTQLKKKRLLSKRQNIWLLDFNDNIISETRFQRAMWLDQAVQVIQNNHVISMRQTVPNDPFFGDQWQWLQDDDHDVDADLAWDITTGGTNSNGQDIVVAVFDDGGDLDHPDLIANNWINVHEIPDNDIDDDNNGYVDDVYGWNFSGNNNNVDGGGHGVSVAGMIGAVGNDGSQGTGINWNVKIMNMRRGGVGEDQVVEFYSYCYDMRLRFNETNGEEGAFVVATNSSWGIDGGNPDDAPLWCGYYDTLGEVGILNCGATANNNVNIDVVGDLPTACPSDFMVSVTATNDNDERTFSAYGPEHVDFGAPGEDIYTTSSNGGYTTTSGTSFASPCTAGIIGLLYSAPCSNLTNLAIADPAAAALQVRDALLEGVDAVSQLEGDVATGGRVNAYNSLLLILENCGPCPAPSAVEVTDLTDVQGTINWLASDDTETVNLRWRTTGSMDWITETNVSNPFMLNGLIACTDYEFEIEAVCADTTGGYSNTFNFQTDGCCENPTEITLADITENGATINWNSILAAQSYNLRYKLISETDWTVVNLADITLTLDNLESCNAYEVQIQTVCVDQTLDYGPSTFLNIPGCGACQDLTYCEVIGGTVDEWIETVSFAGYTNDSGDDGGYGDYTGLPIELVTFNEYPIAATPGYSGTIYDEAFTVFIDFNQDGTFDENTELVFESGLTEVEVTGTFVVPATAMEGITRMRFVMRYNQPNGPCGEFQYGEGEDYCVNITAGTPPDCSIPTDLSSSDVSYEGGQLSWEPVTDANAYNLQYQVAGSGNWNSIEDISNDTYYLDNLQDCTEYEVQVQSLCAAGFMGDFSESFTFTTECFPDCSEMPSGLTATSVTFYEATVSWSAATNAESYDLRYRPTAGGGWDTENTTATTLELINLDQCVVYECQVRTVCIGGNSEYSESTIFTTECDPNDVEDLQVGSFNLFPNPVTDGLFVEHTFVGEVQFSIVDVTGRILRAGILNANNEIDVNGLDAGIYFLQLNNIAVKSFVKM